jgi:hypothetical protein
MTRWSLSPTPHFGTLSNTKGHILGTLSNIKHKVNLIIWREPEVIVVGGMDLMPIRSFPSANNRVKTPPPSPFLGGIFRNIKVGVLIFFQTFLRLDVQQNLVTHNLKNMKKMETRHNFLVFIWVSHNTKETFDNPNLVRQFENSTNPLRKPMLPHPPPQKEKRCLS